MSDVTSLPVCVIGAGPIGLAAAAHLLERGLTPLLLETGVSAAAAVRQWGHIALFSPWRFNVDPTARKMLEARVGGWKEPPLDGVPTGAELVARYLEPLAALPPIAAALRVNTRVLAVSRDALDKTQSRGRAKSAMLVRVQTSDGRVEDHRVRAVIDASGTWTQPNPVGRSGLDARGEREARDAGRIVRPLMNVLSERAKFAGRRVLVVGGGHSAANSLLALEELDDEHSRSSLSSGSCCGETPNRLVWAVRGSRANMSGLFGGGRLDEQLPARGSLGARLRALVDSGRIEIHTGCIITGMEMTPAKDGGDSGSLVVLGSEVPSSEDGKPKSDAALPMRLEVDFVIPAAGFRPDVSMLRELRVEIDSVLEAPRSLAPLIDPSQHSCGSVPVHGWRVLSHPNEPNFFIVGMKSYGRAPTFLMATGYEQVRSVVAAIAGDLAAADDVRPHILPESLTWDGVCSSAKPSRHQLMEENPEADSTIVPVQATSPAHSSCCTPGAAAPAPASNGATCASGAAPVATKPGCCGASAAKSQS